MSRAKNLRAQVINSKNRLSILEKLSIEDLGLLEKEMESKSDYDNPQLRGVVCHIGTLLRRAAGGGKVRAWVGPTPLRDLPS